MGKESYSSKVYKFLARNMAIDYNKVSEADFNEKMKSPDFAKSMYSFMKEAQRNGIVGTLKPYEEFVSEFGTTTTPTTTTETEVVSEEETPQQGTPARTFPTPQQLKQPVTNQQLPNVGVQPQTNQPQPTPEETQIAPIDQQAGQVQGGMPISGDVLANAPRQEFQWSGQAPTKPVVQPVQQNINTMAPEQSMSSGNSYADVLSNAAQRGFNRGEIASILISDKQLGREEYAKVAELTRKNDELATSEYMQKFASDPDLSSTLLALPEIAVESIASLYRHGLSRMATGAVAGGAAGSVVPIAGTLTGAGTGILAGMTVAGFGLELSSTILETLKEFNIDTKDERALEMAFKSPALMDYAKTKAYQRGIPIAIFDAFSMGIAGTLLRKPVSSAVSRGLRILGEAGIQGALGATGEATAQLVSGQDFKPYEILAEGLAEIPGSVPEVAIAVMSKNKSTGGNTKTDAARLVANNPDISGEVVSEMVDIGVGSGEITAQQADEIKSDVIKAQEIDAKIPAEIKDTELRVAAIGLIEERDNLTAQLETVDEAFKPAIQEKIKGINEQLQELSQIPQQQGTQAFFETNQPSQTNPLLRLPESVDAVMDKIDQGILVSAESLFDVYNSVQTAIRETLANRAITPEERSATINILSGMLTDIDRANTRLQQSQISEQADTERYLPAVKYTSLPKGQQPGSKSKRKRKTKEELSKEVERQQKALEDKKAEEQKRIAFEEGKAQPTIIQPSGKTIITPTRYGVMDLPGVEVYFDNNSPSETNPLNSLSVESESTLDKINDNILISPESLSKAYNEVLSMFEKVMNNNALSNLEKGATLNILNGMLSDIDSANKTGQDFVEQVEEVSVQDRVPAVREGVKPLPQGQASKGTATPSISQAKAIREENRRKQAGTTTLPSSGQTIITPAPATTEVATEVVTETSTETTAEAEVTTTPQAGGVGGTNPALADVESTAKATDLDSKAEINNSVSVGELDSSYTIEPISKDNPMYKLGYRYEARFDFPESLGENGNYSDGNYYKEIPTKREVISDITKTLNYELEQLNSQEYLSGRDEAIKQKLEEVNAKQKQQTPTQDAVQKQTAGQVPVQSGTTSSQEVAKGEPKAEPQSTADKGQAKATATQEEVGGLPKEIADLYQRRGQLEFTKNALEKQMGNKPLVGKSKKEYDNVVSELASVESQIKEYEDSKIPQQKVSEESKTELLKTTATEPATTENDYANYLLDLIEQKQKELGWKDSAELRAGLAKQFNETLSDRGLNRAISDLESTYVQYLPEGVRAGAYQTLKKNFEKQQATAQTTPTAETTVTTTTEVKPVKKTYEVFRGQDEDYEVGVYDGTYGKGKYYTGDRKSAKVYGKNVTSHKVELSNPFIIKGTRVPGVSLEGMKDYINENVIPKGYDGVILLDGKGNIFELVKFETTTTTPTEVTLNTPNETTIKDIEKIENATEKGRELALSKPVNKWVKRAFDSFQDLSSRAKKAGIYDGTTLKIGGKEYTVDTPAKFKAFLAQSQANFDAINEAVKDIPSEQKTDTNPSPKTVEEKSKEVFNDAKSTFVFPIGLNPKFKFDSRLPENVVRFFKKYFRPRGLWTKGMFSAKRGMENQISAQVQKSEFLVRDLRNAVKEAYPKGVTQEQLQAMNDVLQGMPREIPANLYAPLTKMREHIDELSQMMISEGIIDEKLVPVFDANMGIYTTRTYAIHNDPKSWLNYIENEPEGQQIRNNAVNFLRQATEAKADRLDKFADENEKRAEKLFRRSELAEGDEALMLQAKADEVIARADKQRELARTMREQDFDAQIEAFLFAEGQPLDVVRKGNVGAKDLGVLKKRKNIPDAIRALMGEEKDPLTNYTMSVAKMSALIANNQFLNEVKAQGVTDGLFTKTPQGKNTVQIASASTDSMSPLNGLYTTKDIAEAFKEFDANTKSPWYIDAMLWFNAAVKVNKTVLSQGTHIRNFISNPIIELANGYIPTLKGKAIDSQMEQILNRRFGDKEKLREYIIKLTELGVLGQGGNYRDILSVYEDLKGNKYDYQKLIEPKITGAAKKSWNIAQKVYKGGDEFWKVVAFENERAVLEKAYGDTKTSEELDQMAADIIRKTRVDYSMVPKAVKAINKIPFTGTFVTFPAEVLRIGFNIPTVAYEEMNSGNKVLREHGIKRMAGYLTAMTLPYGVKELAKYLLGMDDEEEEARKKFLAPWAQNSTLIWIGKDRYIDTGFSDAFSILKKPIVAFSRGKSAAEGALNATKEFLGPVISEEIGYKTLKNVSDNTDEFGNPIYDENADAGTIYTQVSTYVLKQVEPGTVSQARRLYLGETGALSEKGQQYRTGDEVLNAVFGIKPVTINWDNAVSYKFRDAVEGINNSNKFFLKKSKELRKDDKEGRRKAAESTNLAVENAYNDLREYYTSALKIGMIPQKVVDIMKQSGVPKELMYAVVNNTGYKNYIIVLNDGTVIDRNTQRLLRGR